MKTLTYPKKRQIKSLEGFMKGLGEYINSSAYQGTQKPMALLDKAQRKLDAIKNDEHLPSQLDKMLCEVDDTLGIKEIN